MKNLIIINILQNSYTHQKTFLSNILDQQNKNLKYAKTSIYLQRSHNFSLNSKELTALHTTLKLLSHLWWIFIPKITQININSSISQLIIISSNRIFLMSLKSLFVIKKCETNLRLLWTWKHSPIL